MDVAQVSMGIADYKTHEVAGMKMLKNIKEQMQVQGDNFVAMVESTEINVNDGKSLDVRI